MAERPFFLSFFFAISVEKFSQNAKIHTLISPELVQHTDNLYFSLDGKDYIHKLRLYTLFENCKVWKEQEEGHKGIIRDSRW